ncbi:GL25337, partial [Drosophila persimilis]
RRNAKVEKIGTDFSNISGQEYTPNQVEKWRSTREVSTTNEIKKTERLIRRL